jgi:DinB family protein
MIRLPEGSPHTRPLTQAVLTRPEVMKMNRPLETEYAPSFQGYVAHVTEDEILPVLRSQIDAVDLLLDRVSPEKETYRYAEGKWSIREIVGHLIDGERVFGYRALCIARGETQNLPGFDQDDYMISAPYDRINLEDLLSEFRLVRLSNIAMFRTLDEAAWTRTGIANNNQVSVRALAFIMAGHVRHHMKVLRERYLTASADTASASASQPNAASADVSSALSAKREARVEENKQ